MQLLRHPLTRRRLATLVGALEQARLPLAAVQPLAGQLGPALFRIVQVSGGLGNVRQPASASRIAASPVVVWWGLGQLRLRSNRAPPPHLLSRAGQEEADGVCVSTTSFLHLLIGLLLPVLLSVHCWPAQPAGAGGSGSGSSSSSSASGGSSSGWCQRFRHNAVTVGSTADAWLRRLLGSNCGPLGQSLVCMYWLANCWLLCRP